MITIIEVTDLAGNLLSESALNRAESVHRQLRPKLPENYADTMRRVFAQGGRMLLAEVGGVVRGVAVWRCYENTAYGRFVYVDDLISDETHRSKGVGKALLDRCREIALAQQCQMLTLDSGTHRTQAHKFYFREHMTISAFHFVEPLDRAEVTG